MESNKSWSIDDYRNKFQFGCEYGKLIENGKLTRPKESELSSDLNSFLEQPQGFW
ncbi:hypothetical protein Ct9H90mP29_16070 [bacterium]|nr:MAG: hypothetical protein Ct9H90mP29_16070 [bacterium]